MDLTIYPSKLQGEVSVIPSKSQTHRFLICAAFADKPTFINCSGTNQDIDATISCLQTLGVEIFRQSNGFQVIPAKSFPASAVMNCGESGTTLRFLLPVVCALDINTTFQLSGRLPYRPLSPLCKELERMGCNLSWPTETTIQTAGKLSPGFFKIPGNISSQYISGLLFASAVMNGNSHIEIAEPLESKPYVEMTQIALSQFGISTTGMNIIGSLPLHSPGNISIEGDWSNGAFFLVANALGSNIYISNLCEASSQGDRIIVDIIRNMCNISEISAADFPDLVPIMAVLFGTKKEVTFTDINRLRLKESDRVETICSMMTALGAGATASENSISITPGRYHSCIIDAKNDHRIAMSAAIAATCADGPVTILGAECVSKSYPAFWQEYRRLGGKYEQYIR